MCRLLILIACSHRNGTEWNGTERNGTERNGTERNETELNGTERLRIVPSFASLVSSFHFLERNDVIWSVPMWTQPFIVPLFETERNGTERLHSRVNGALFAYPFIFQDHWEFHSSYLQFTYLVRSTNVPSRLIGRQFSVNQTLTWHSEVSCVKAILTYIFPS